MAIKKEITLDSGVSAGYHNISFNVCKKDSVCILTVHSYLNEDSRKNKCAPVTNENFFVPIEFWEERYSKGESISGILYDYLNKIEKYSEGETI